MTFSFRCNNSCTFCMVEDVLNVLPGTSLEQFQSVVADGSTLEGVSRIILTGGEVTLSKELPSYAEFARSLPGIEHVRIQTNGTRLANRDYVKTLISAGVDEYFVSFHAPDSELYNRIVRHDGGFDQVIGGIENIVAEGASLTTNTVIVADNYRRLEEIVERIAPFSPQSMEFWNYWPRGDEDAERGVSARVGDVQPYLRAALERLLTAGLPPVIKWYPRCLLGPFARYLNDVQPRMLSADEYWLNMPAYSCLYEGVCADAARACSGLSHSYIRQHGWEESLLVPARLEDRHVGTHSLVKDSVDKRSHADRIAAWLTTFDLAVGMEVEGFRLTGAALGQGVVMLALEFERGPDHVDIRLYPLNERRAAFTRTNSFNLVYTRVPPQMEQDAQHLAAALARILSPRDAGGRALPG